MSIAKYVVDGLMAIADSVADTGTYSYPKSGGFECDRRRLSGDIHAVGSDMKKAISIYGRKQPYKHKRPE
jgi:hypothetical protein